MGVGAFAFHTFEIQIIGGYIGQIDKLPAEAVARWRQKKTGSAKQAEAVLGSEYLKRLMEDEQLRENLLAAYGRRAAHTDA